MKLIIDIPEELTEKDHFYTEKEKWSIVDAVQNGIPLPDKHGRLIDGDELRCENADFDTYNDYCLMFDEIDNAPTIIEAEGGDSE